MDKIKLLILNPKFAKYQMVVLATVAVLICTLLIAFMIVPQTYKLLEANNQINDLKTKNDVLSGKLSLLETLNIDEYKNGLNNSLLALPDEKDLPSVIGQVISLVSSSGLNLEDFNFSNPIEPPGAVQSVVAVITVSGDRSSLKSFFDKIQQNPRMMRIGKVGVTSSSNASKSQANLDILVYFQPLPTNFGDIEQPVVLLTDDEKKLLASFAQNTPSILTPQASTESASPVGKQDPFQ